MKRIIVIEDEARLLGAMIDSLKKISGTSVRGFLRLGPVADQLAELKPDLIFSDLKLPDANGLELLEVMKEIGIFVPIVFISSYAFEFAPAVSDPRVEFYEKPLALDRINAIATRKLGVDSDEFMFKLTDYLQIAALSGHSVLLEVNEVAAIQLVDGALVAAQDQDGIGEDAFKRLVVQAEVFAGTQKIICRKQKNLDSIPRNIFVGMDQLLLNALCEAEEKINVLSQEIQFDESPPPFGALMDQGLDLLLDKQYQKAWETFQQAAQMRPDDRVVKANLERLIALGYGNQSNSDDEPTFK